MIVVLGADRFAPDRARRAVTTIFPHHRPRAGERIVDHRDLVDEQVRIALVEIDALPDNGLVVRVQRQAGAVEGAGTLHVAGLSDQRVVAAVAVGILPVGARIATGGRPHLLGAWSPPGMGAARGGDVVGRAWGCGSR